jgi:hypothetical protein
MREKQRRQPLRGIVLYGGPWLFSGTHHVDDLLQRDPKGEHESLGLIEYRPVQ